MAVYVWYDAENEVNPATSWTGLCPTLREAVICPVNQCRFAKVLELNEFDRNDAIISLDADPLLTIEQTIMNPSGHNLPQRFAKLVKAAEFGVPAIYYYPEYARRSNSDPNPRYVNVRVPLSQFRLTELFEVPSLSVLWPTDPSTLQPSRRLVDHQNLANSVDEIVNAGLQGRPLWNLPYVQRAQQEMTRVIGQYGHRYPTSPSWRAVYPQGLPWTARGSSRAVDPPDSCELVPTHAYLSQLWATRGRRLTSTRKTEFLAARTHSMVFRSTLNAEETGPEHPYPGHAAMLDILYARNGRLPQDREVNLICELPITLDVYRTQTLNHVTGLYILNEIADVIVLADAAVAAGFLRQVSPGAVLVE